jgi:serine/threonine-protein kinase
VALKSLPEAFALDGDRIARFRREAQVLAALNHPNIAAIYGVEDSGSTHALVLELVDGLTLADRIAKGPVSLDETLPIARQIAEALEAAHEQGIVHRDLKPANIKLREEGTVKVLDFGLAKALEPASAISPMMTASPTITTPAQMTGVGMILGTAAYMSPEQAKGRPADKRSDIWAFGCVLYEMLTGKRAFDGEDVSDTLAFVLTKEPDWNVLPANTPVPIRRLLRRALEKDRKRRLPDIGSARLDIDEALSAPATELSTATVTAAPSRAAWHTALTSALAVALGAMALVWAPWRKPSTPPPAPVTRFSIAFDGRVGTPGQFASISPDGTKIVYATDRLYIRPLAESTARPIAGTDLNGIISNPTFSPDGSSVAFWFGSGPKGELKKVAVDGGPVMTIAPAPVPIGVSWGTDGIVYATLVQTSVSHLPRGIVRVSPNGGQPQQLVALKDGEAAVEPQMLPGQNALLFTYQSAWQPNQGLATWDKARIVVQSLATGQRAVVVDGGSGGRYVSTGHLLYAVGGALLAVPFDAKAHRATGPPVQVLENVKRPGTGNFALGNALFSVSDTGSLLYVAGESIVQSPNSTIVLGLLNGQGDLQPLNLPPGPYEFPHVSPDGKRIVYSTDDGTEAIVWMYELSGTQAPLRLTYEGRNRWPIWSPDGQWIAFQSNRDNGNGIFRQRVDGTGTVERLTRATGPADIQVGPARASLAVHIPMAWSAQPTGDVLLFADMTPGVLSTLLALRIADRKATPWGGIAGRLTEPVIASFSPDGRWVAYAIAEESGWRLYVQPFPATGAKYQIAVNAMNPVWSRNGRELFYMSNLTQMPRLSRVNVTTSPAFTFTNPTSVELKRLPSGVIGGNYDVLSDGRFIYRATVSDAPAQAPANPPIQVVLNWFTELQQRAPVK